ncbi:1234_t:CDS:2 [Funneliformis geosporum]|uniref:1234_t:CDS:1 n=1 Tax=Funneliformis geosporum TaxID=1117311 RepID=A0A9W4SJ92_9GLOM|nr:1234_t:CDS:2 [Funneliformis geosporum]
MTEYLLTLSSDFTTLLEKSDDFNSEEFLDVNENVILQLLKRDDLGVEEIDIWDFLIKWGIKNADIPYENDIENWSSEDFSALEKTLCNLIPFLRLFHISSKDFYHKVWPFEQILPKKLRDDLLSFYLTGEEPNVVIQAPRISPSNIDSEIILPKHAILISNYIVKKNIHSSTFALPLTPTSSPFKNEGDITKTTLAQLQQQPQSSEIISKISRVRPYFIDGAIFDTQFNGPCFGYGDIWFGNKAKPRYGSCTRVYYEHEIRDEEGEFFVEDIEGFQVIEK